MSDIDPFEQPPLVEWENCITHDEIEYMLERYGEAYSLIRWWQIKKKIEAKAILSALVGIDLYLHSKLTKGYTDETIN